MSWATVVGGLVEAVGLGNTGWGIRKTWLGSGIEEGFTDPVVRWSKRTTMQADRRVRRLLQRPGKSTIILAADSAVVSMSASVGAVGVVGWQPLDPALPTTEALAELDTRLRNLQWIVDENRKADLLAMAEVGTRTSETAIEVADVRNRLAEATRDLAVGGLRIEAVGLGLVGFGLAIQLIGSAF